MMNNFYFIINKGRIRKIIKEAYLAEMYPNNINNINNINSIHESLYKNNEGNYIYMSNNEDLDDKGTDI